MVKWKRAKKNKVKKQKLNISNDAYAYNYFWIKIMKI